jgi:hypothetical protein
MVHISVILREGVKRFMDIYENIEIPGIWAGSEIHKKFRLKEGKDIGKEIDYSAILLSSFNRGAFSRPLSIKIKGEDNIQKVLEVSDKLVNKEVIVLCDLVLSYGKKDLVFKSVSIKK